MSQSLSILLLAMLLAGPALAASAVNESARKIPLAYDVDVVVVGGSTGGVAAAVAAAEAERRCARESWSSLTRTRTAN